MKLDKIFFILLFLLLCLFRLSIYGEKRREHRFEHIWLLFTCERSMHKKEHYGKRDFMLSLSKLYMLAQTHRERERLTEEDEIRKASKHSDVVKRIYHHACLLQTVVDCVVLRRILNFFYFSFVIVVVVVILQH